MSSPPPGFWMLEKLLVQNVWVTPILWAAIYISDYYTTIFAARLYKAGANKHVIFQGSIELTPVFQDDVDNLRKISPRFLWRLAISTCVVIAMWILTVRWLELRPLFSF